MLEQLLLRVKMPGIKNGLIGVRLLECSTFGED